MPTSDVTHRETVGLLAQCLRAAMLIESRGKERGEEGRKGEERRKLRED